MFRNYNRQPDGRMMFRIGEGWSFCSYEQAIAQGWQPTKADLEYKQQLKEKGKNKI